MADTTNEFRYLVFKVKNTHATDPKSCLPNSRTRSIENGRYSFVFIKSNKLGPSFSKTCNIKSEFRCLITTNEKISSCKTPLRRHSQCKYDSGNQTNA